MPTNHTPNYQLSQWERTDKILMDDFNADNAKIDAVLGEHAARLDKCGNCQTATYTYHGNGNHGAANPTVIPFPKGTFLLLIMNTSGTFHHLLPGTARLDWHESGVGHFYAPITWSETGLSIYSDRNSSYQFNANTDYLVLSFQKIGDE